MKRFLIHSVLVVAFLTTALIGCDPGTGRQVGQNVDDASITAAVKAKLAAEQGATTLTGINVDTSGGTVSLSGTVDSEAMKQRAESLTQQVEGVARVVNNLQVRASG
jgi:hyperosmotically inducible periplasmic protein